ncbi:MAG TPA: glycine cleavage system protein H [Gemmataceae bacterium]|nr:glycine cleavage system protein H [Gemmataceae bacterium]
MMGKFAAALPADRRYCRNHMWCQVADSDETREAAREGEAPAEPSARNDLSETQVAETIGSAGALPSRPAGSALARSWRFGFTAYAVRLMQDVYFIDWEANAGDVLALKQKIGHIETSKAMSDLFAPIAGTLSGFNADVLNDPSAINVDMYGNGWLFEMAGDAADTLSVQEYHDFLAAGWEKTQNMLKGHM